MQIVSSCYFGLPTAIFCTFKSVSSSKFVRFKFKFCGYDQNQFVARLQNPFGLFAPIKTFRREFIHLRFTRIRKNVNCRTRFGFLLLAKRRFSARQSRNLLQNSSGLPLRFRFIQFADFRKNILQRNRRRNRQTFIICRI